MKSILHHFETVEMSIVMEVQSMAQETPNLFIWIGCSVVDISWDLRCPLLLHYLEH